MVAGAETPVDSHEPKRIAPHAALEVRLFGQMRIARGGVAVALPASRKVRALLAFLALSPHPIARTRLCELLWDVPNDPRGELRWSLSKIRGLVDDPGRRRVETVGDTVRLDLTDCFVDAVEVDRAARAGVAGLDPDRLRELAALCKGDFLDGFEVDRSPAFDGWLAAQRRRLRSCHAALLDHLVGRVPDEEALGYLEIWLRLAPFDRKVHELLLTALARRDRIPEGEEHLAATARLFEAEGLDWSPIREAWRMARARTAAPPVRVADEPSAPDSVVGTAITAAVTATAAGNASVGLAEPAAEGVAASRRASIAVMPFADRSAASDPGGRSAEGLVHDVITRLAKLRSLFVIGQGTVFALHERRIGPEEAGRMLNVDYVVGGTLRRHGDRLIVSVELSETRTARIVWADTFDEKLDDAFAVLDKIGDRVVASIASEVETVERNRAILKPPNSLDAWEAHHRGLWHMYRFTREDNERARRFFERAVQLDPTFSRAHAGVSFTHFQNAFQGWAPREPEVRQALAAAGQSLMADDHDPAAHWAMGRALWLGGSQNQSVDELSRAIDLSPNFAVGHYALAFVHSQAGDPVAAVEAADQSRLLSPFDPLLFAILGSRAMALVRLGRFDEAADWAMKAAARPNAHAHVLALAAYSLALVGRLDLARGYLASIHETQPGYGVDNLLAAMRFDLEGATLFRNGAVRIGNA